MAETSLSSVGFAGLAPVSAAGLPAAPAPGANAVTAADAPAPKVQGGPRRQGLVQGGDASDLPADPHDPALAATATDAATAPGAAAGDGSVNAAVKKANQSLSAGGTQLVFVFDDQQHHAVVKLLDIQTQKVVQEIPSAAMPGTASALSGDSSSGALIDTEA
jgi:flagellar protein FlaG